MSIVYFTLRIGGDGVVTIGSGPTAKTYTGPGSHNVSLSSGFSYTISYSPPTDGNTQFSRYTSNSNNLIINSSTSSSTRVQIPYGVTIFSGVITVYTKARFHAQLEGNGRVEIRSTNPTDSTVILSINGYNATGSAFFEQNVLSGTVYRYSCLYIANVSGYRVGSWYSNTIPTNTTELLTIPIYKNTSQTPLYHKTNVTLDLTQNIGGSIISSPPGIATDDIVQANTTTFPYGTNIVLRSTPSNKYSFLFWDTPTGEDYSSTLVFNLTQPLTIDGVFSANIVQAIARDYVPSQGERADAQHICQCPCACTGCQPAFTSALNHTRQIRALISGSCCQYIPVGVVLTDGGAGYAVGDILQLVGGNPLEKPALFRVTAVSGSFITGLKLIYGQPYRIRPESDTLVAYTGAGIGGLFTVVWASCQSPANLYRQ